MVIENTLFQQHKRRLYTWPSPDGHHQNQTDYILHSQRWRNSIQSAKTRPGADCGSDHELLIAKFRLKLKKHIYFCFIDYVDHNKLWKILKEKGIPDHLTCLLRNPYAGQEAAVRTRHGTTDWFQIGKGVHQDCILSPCLFNFYAEYIMRNTGVDEAQAGIKIAGRNISNLRDADNTTVMAKAKRN